MISHNKLLVPLLAIAIPAQGMVEEALDSTSQSAPKPSENFLSKSVEEPVSQESSLENLQLFIAQSKPTALPISRDNSLEETSTPPPSPPKVPSLTPEGCKAQFLATFDSYFSSSDEDERQAHVDFFRQLMPKYIQLQPGTAQNGLYFFIIRALEKYGMESDIIQLIALLKSLDEQRFLNLTKEILPKYLSGFLSKGFIHPELFRTFTGTPLELNELVESVLYNTENNQDNMTEALTIIITQGQSLHHAYQTELLAFIRSSYLYSAPDAYILIVYLTSSPCAAVRDVAINRLIEYCVKETTPYRTQRNIIKRLMNAPLTTNLRLLYGHLYISFVSCNNTFGVCFLWKCMSQSKHKLIHSDAYGYVLGHFPIKLNEQERQEYYQKEWSAFFESVLRKVMNSSTDHATRLSVLKVLAYSQLADLAYDRKRSKQLIDRKFLSDMRKMGIFEETMYLKERVLLLDDFCEDKSFKNNESSIRERLSQLPASSFKTYALTLCRALETASESFENCTARKNLIDLHRACSAFSAVPVAVQKKNGALPCIFFQDDDIHYYHYLDAHLSQPQVANNRLYGFIQKSQHFHLSCYDMNTGLLLWKFADKLYENRDIPLLFEVGKNFLYLARHSGVITMLDKETGRYVRDILLASDQSITALGHTMAGVLYVIQEDLISGCNAETGAPLFSKTLDERPLFWNVSDENLIVVTDMIIDSVSKRYLRIFNAKGDERIVPSPASSPLPSSIRNNYFFTISKDQGSETVSFFCFDKTEPLWSYTMTGTIDTALLIPGNGLLLCTKKMMVFLEWESEGPKVRWQMPLPECMEGFPINSYAQSDSNPRLLYVLKTNTEDLYSINSMNGTYTWMNKRYDPEKVALLACYQERLYFKSLLTRHVAFAKP